MRTKQIWSGPVRILYFQSGPVRLVRSEKYTQPLSVDKLTYIMWSLIPEYYKTMFYTVHRTVATFVHFFFNILKSSRPLSIKLE